MKINQKLLVSLIAVTFAASPAYAAGSITGKINFTGTAPEEPAIDMAADPVCAGQHPEPIKTEEVIVNADNTLKNVFVYVKEGLPAGQTYPAPATPVTLDQKGCHYSPHVFGVQVGQDIEIVNSDSTLHNVHGMPTQSKEFNLGMPIPGMKLKRKFEKQEVAVKFKCDVHPWMNAYVGVVDHPFYAVTGDNGTFEIKDLPAGNYVIEAWHEKYGTQTANVTVAEGAAATADLSFAAA